MLCLLFDSSGHLHLPWFSVVAAAYASLVFLVHSLKPWGSVLFPASRFVRWLVGGGQPLKIGLLRVTWTKEIWPLEKHTCVHSNLTGFYWTQVQSDFEHLAVPLMALFKKGQVTIRNHVTFLIWTVPLSSEHSHNHQSVLYLLRYKKR